MAQPVIMQTGQPAAVAITIPDQKARRYKNPGCLKCVGITTIVFGSLIFVMGIVTVVMSYVNGYTVTGIWTGIFITITGILGLLTATKQKDGTLAGIHTCMATLVSIFAGVGGILYIVAAVAACASTAKTNLDISTNIGGVKVNTKNIDDLKDTVVACGTFVGLAAVCIVILFVQFILSVTAACIGCQGTCCRTKTAPGAVIVANPQPVAVTTMNAPPPVYAQAPYDHTKRKDSSSSSDSDSDKKKHKK